ncbi:hypothetical protein SAMN06272769_10574 [Alcanivorax sp. DSM 26295]|nr:hypothetical protein SAMN06272769_10574 [Alcanivorax sp. DSM 26295]
MVTCQVGSGNVHIKTIGYQFVYKCAAKSQ